MSKYVALLVFFFFLSLKNGLQIVKIMAKCKDKLYPQTGMENVAILILI